MAPDDPAAFLASSFGLGRAVSLRQVARGAMGAVLRLEVETPAGPATYAVKQPFWQCPEEADVVREVGFSAACADAGVPLARPLAATGGEYVVSDGERCWRLYDWVDGVVPKHSDVSATVWLATQMSVIHGLGQPAELDPLPFYHRVDVDWVELAGAAAEAGTSWAPAMTARVPQFEELTALVNGAPIGTQIWCHRDLKNTNVVRGRTDRWLVDWDNSGPMAPWRELGLLLMHHISDEEALRRIVGAYRSAGGTASIDGPEGFATGLAVWLNFLAGQAGSLLDPDLPELHRNFALSRVTGLLRVIPGPVTLDRAAVAMLNRA